jgi:hypothetical protein
VVGVLLHMGVQLLGVAPRDNAFVLGIAKHLGTQAADFAGIDILPAECVAADLLDSLAAGRSDSLVEVDSDIEIEAAKAALLGLLDLPDILLDILEVVDPDILESGNHFAVENHLDTPAQGWIGHVGSLLPASEPLGLHHCQSVPAHIDHGDDGGAT